MSDLTAIILTKNESKNIIDCLESLKGLVKRVIIIDSGSTDGTLLLVNQYDTDVYFHKFENYSKQFNWAIENTNITTKWILRLDADERITLPLRRELELLMEKHNNDNVNGITMEADFYFLGKHIKHGGRKRRKIMLFKTGFGKIEDRKMDEHTIIFSGRVVSTKEKFIHKDNKNIDHYVKKLNWYATREMQDYLDYINNQKISELHDRKVRRTRMIKFIIYYKLPMFIRSYFLFIFFYIFQLGFLDGLEGFIYHYLYQRWYRLLVDIKIHEQKLSNLPFEETGDLK